MKKILLEGIMGGNVVIISDVPGGNIIVDEIVGNRVKLRQDYSKSDSWWFWWNFAVEGAAGRTLIFEFTDNDAFSSLGPCCYDGTEWTFLGADVVRKNSFCFKFPEDAEHYCFAFSIPYTQVDLDKFLAANPEIKSETLAMTTENREVQLLSVISEQSKCNVLLTARHHACEVTASFVLEGIFEYWLSDPDLRKSIDLRAVPFADIDGVCNGDQGKNRAPHDHNRDYGPFIYAMPKALISKMSEWPRTAVSLDLHNPYLKETEIYFVGARKGQDQIDSFTKILKKNQSGPLCYDAAADIPFGTGWNTNAHGLGNSSYLRDNHLSDMAATIEIPYAQAGEIIITPENLRAFGHDLARSIKEYISSK
jgi:hypothetical protein